MRLPGWLAVATCLLLRTTAQSASALPVAQDQEQCSAARLVVAGTDDSGTPGMWWVSPDDGAVEQIDAGTTYRSYLVDVSPDAHWLLYYQSDNAYNPATDRFVVDTWVMDLGTEQRYEINPGSAPLGWTTDSSAVVSGEHPMTMARVPTGELVASQGQLVMPLSMRSVLSPDGQLRATVEKTPQGAGGISINSTVTGDEVIHVPTGRGAPQLAWSPDSTRLAFTNGRDSAAGLVWQLHMLDIGTEKASIVDVTSNLRLHSVLWPPPAPDCQAI